MTWENYNGHQALKKITVFGIVGGIAGNEFYKWEFREESKKEFSSDNFLRNLVREENPNLNPVKLQELKSITKEVKDKLYNEFSDSKYRPHPLLKKMVRANNLGRKTGKGFYEY